VLGAIEQAIDRWSALVGTPILTCLPAARGPLRKLTEKFFPQLVILSHNEIPPNVKIETLGVVGINHAVA
jgi:flagellar biosynthesis protein FlhA